jgi:predicted XRE-type DNA-binding protein
MSKNDYVKSSGNVFKDLGLPDHETELLKSRISIAIFKLLSDKYGSKTQTEISEILGIDQPEVSKLKHGNFARFSLERLLYFLNRLNYDVDIKISEATGHAPHQYIYFQEGLSAPSIINNNQI